MIIIGSARHDERGRYTGGKAGDQDGTEVSTQELYIHSKGWDILRPINGTFAYLLSSAMKLACNNPNLGYDQNERLGVIRNGIAATEPTECDCSSLVRACIKYASGQDVGDFTTYNEKNVLIKSGLFTYVGRYKEGMRLVEGDTLVTCTKGHTVIVIHSDQSQYENYYPVYMGSSTSIVDALSSLGVDWSMVHRKRIASANGIDNYTGKAVENLELLRKLKKGILIRE